MKKDSQTSLKSGFSLVELLTVMAIISVLLSIASVGIKNIGKAQGVTSGLAISEGVFSQAQRLARSQATTARVIIHTEMNDDDLESKKRYRRLMLVVYKKIDPDTGQAEPNWTIFGQPKLLPESVYYSVEKSRTDVRGEGGEMPKETFKLSRDEADQAECHYYEFNSQGLCTIPGCSFILESGPRPKNSATPKLGSSRNYGGFVIWRQGGTSKIQDLDRLDSVSN